MPIDPIVTDPFAVYPFTNQQASEFWHCSGATARRRMAEAVRDGAAFKRGRKFWARPADLEAWALGQWPRRPS